MIGCEECGTVEDEVLTEMWRVKKGEALSTAIDRLKAKLGRGD